MESHTVYSGAWGVPAHIGPPSRHSPFVHELVANGPPGPGPLNSGERAVGAPDRPKTNSIRPTLGSFQRDLRPVSFPSPLQSPISHGHRGPVGRPDRTSSPQSLSWSQTGLFLPTLFSTGEQRRRRGAHTQRVVLPPAGASAPGGQHGPHTRVRAHSPGRAQVCSASLHCTAPHRLQSHGAVPSGFATAQLY